MTSFSLGSLGVSPAFSITSEEFTLRYLQAVTRFAIDGVEPPNLGAQGGTSAALALVNYWHPWIDEQLLAPKFDGVCKYLGTPSNNPTVVKDYHHITLMRAVDYLLAPRYQGLIISTVDTVNPAPPSIE